jgi:hypothetical protein
MPLRLNLLAEDQALEEMRRKDPVKRAIWLGSFAVFLVLLWGLTLFLKVTIARTEVTRLEAAWTRMEKAVKEVENNRLRQREMEQRLSAMAQFATNRFFYANLLNALQQTSVDRVHLVRFKSTHTIAQTDGAKPAAGFAAGTPAGAVPSSSKTPLASEKIVLLLEGRDLSGQNGEQVPQYRQGIASLPYFQQELQKTNSILLTSLSAPVGEGSKKSTSVVFGLQLNFQEKERRLYE